MRPHVGINQVLLADLQLVAADVDIGSHHTAGSRRGCGRVIASIMDSVCGGGNYITRRYSGSDMRLISCMQAARYLYSSGGW